MSQLLERTMTSSEKRKDTMLKKKYDDSDMKKNMQAQYGQEEGKKVYFATIRKQAMKKEEVEQVDEAKYEAGASTYGKASIRNKRRFGTKGENPDPLTGKKITKDATRGELITKRREEHKAKRGVKEEVGITTHSMMMKDKAKKERMADPDRGINSPAFKKFMASQGM